MNLICRDEEAIFQLARRIDEPTTRRAYLDQACSADHGLRDRLEALLRVHEEDRSFLESPVLDPARTAVMSPPDWEVRSTIGPYKLLEPIGEGAWASSTWPSRRPPYAAGSR